MLDSDRGSGPNSGPLAVFPGDEFDPRVYTFYGRLFRTLCRLWFRFTLRGMERIPAQQCLFVGNHSGLGIVDVGCLLGAWQGRFGLTRRVVGMMHVTFVRAPLAGRLFRGFGAVMAAYDNGKAALAAGHDVMTFPGGDIDGCRPFYMPRAVRFATRRGYIRLALEAGVPVVPIATIGSHYTYLMAPGGEWIARNLGFERFTRNICVPLPLACVGVVASIALALAGVVPWWLAATGFIASLLPTPWRVTSEILAPIDIAALTAHIADPEARIEAAHEIVYGTLAEAVRTMSHRTPLPESLRPPESR